MTEENLNELLPPETLSHLGGGGRGFKNVGKKWADMLASPPEGLKPDERVLDAGCGLGRIAIPLAGYLSPTGSYEGFDVAPESIAWCRENITSRYPNFRFQVADIYNKSYNPGGSQRASEYSFPYEDEYFDFVFLASVFTHLLPEDMENYLAQTSRVLEGGGRCVVSYFLLNEESQRSIETGEITTGPRFPHDYGRYRVQNREIPEVAIAHDEDVVRNLYAKYGLGIVEPVRYGSWPGRKDAALRQDVIWAVKG